MGIDILCLFVYTIDKMTTDNKELGRILRQQRILIPLTLQELSAKAGVSSSHIGRIERGERFPSARILHKLAKPLGFDESDLFSRAGYLSPTAEDQGEPGQLDPYVRQVLSHEPVETQRVVVAVLTILKSMNITLTPGFAEYVHRKYPKVDDDVITMIEDILEHPKG